MIDIKLLEIIHPHDEYIEHADTFNEDPDAIEIRFTAWVIEHKNQLKEIFINLIHNDDIETLNLSYFEWARQKFICWDYNIIQQAKLNNEIEDMLNIELMVTNEIEDMINGI